MKVWTIDIYKGSHLEFCCPEKRLWDAQGSNALLWV